MRVLGLDVGDRRIGVAISDPLGITAQGLESYTRGGDAAMWDHFSQLIERTGAELIVIGLPLKLSGEEGEQAGKVRQFAATLLEKTNVPQTFTDERLTTAQARKTMISGDARRGKRKQSIDQVAACLILQGWLDSAALPGQFASQRPEGGGI